MPQPPRTQTEPLEQDGGEHRLVQQFELHVTSGPDAGATLASTGERMIIGTSPDADLVLHDASVSRFHCEIAVSDGRVTIRDIGSRNGTHVDGISIREAHLTSPATITIGRSQARFAMGHGHVKLALSRRERFGHMAGQSSAMRAIFSVLERAAQSDATVLLLGETGTGKDAAAASIHAESARSGGPFVAVDCAAIPPTLLESELFGHEKGAFTGATTSRTGAFEQAAGGTLFLDEIGELALDMQPKLLRVLESRSIRRVGGGRASPVDVRVVAATNRDLRAEMVAGRFRSDLYYRLAVLEVHLPALRDRAGDTPLLVDAFLASLGAEHHALSHRLRSADALARMEAYTWPGNVRELRNYVERCLVLDEVALVGAPPLSQAPPAVDAAAEPLKLARERYVREFERRYLEQLLRDHHNNVSAAARAAGVDRAHLYRLLTRANLR